MTEANKTPTNPLIEFNTKPPVERLRAVEALLENPAWKALDTLLAMEAVKANTAMLQAKAEFEMIKSAGDMKRIVEIRQWPGQVTSAARGEIEVQKAREEETNKKRRGRKLDTL